MLDQDVRELSIRDLKGDVAIGTPEVLRARNAREFRALDAEAAVPVASREFSRTERLLIRFPAYGPAGAPPVVSAKLLDRIGHAMRALDGRAERRPLATTRSICRSRALRRATTRSRSKRPAARAKRSSGRRSASPTSCCAGSVRLQPDSRGGPKVGTTNGLAFWRQQTERFCVRACEPLELRDRELRGMLERGRKIERPHLAVVHQQGKGDAPGSDWFALAVVRSDLSRDVEEIG